MFTGFALHSRETFLLNVKTSSLKLSPATLDKDHSILPSGTHIADNVSPPKLSK